MKRGNAGGPFGSHPSVSRGALLDSVRGIRWPARRPIPGGVHGAHQSRLRGLSVEFTEYRPYRQGDETRTIDWKLFARTDRAYIRLSNERVILPTTILLDGSRSMAFPLATRGKWELACELAVGLAAVAHPNGDPVGLFMTGVQSPKLLQPRTRRGVIGEIIRTIADATPSNDSPLGPALAASFRVSGRVVVISDFLGDTDALIASARHHVASGRELYAVHVVAAEELDPPQQTVLFSDPELPDVRRPLVGNSRTEYVDAFRAWREELARNWTEAGAFFSLAITNRESTDRIIRRITSSRGGDRSGAAGDLGAAAASERA